MTDFFVISHHNRNVRWQASQLLAHFLDDAQELARVLGVLPECHGEIIVRDLIWESASPGLHGEGVLERGLRGDDHGLHLDVEVLPAAHTHRR